MNSGLEKKNQGHDKNNSKSTGFWIWGVLNERIEPIRWSGGFPHKKQILDPEILTYSYSNHLVNLYNYICEGNAPVEPLLIIGN